MDFIPLGRPDITEKDIDAVAAVLRTGMLIQGKNVIALEEAFTNFVNSKHAVAVSSGTATLHLALKLLGIGHGDEVIVPAFSYVATANVVELVGATPVFVDIELSTFNIDVNQIETKISSHTKAIIPVHEFGLACDMETICSIAEKYKIHVIEDAACALGAVQNSKKAGTFGIIGSFSLHPRKSITSGEGGILVTEDDRIAVKLRQLRNHGIEMKEGIMYFPEAGFNYRMTDFQAALALSQMSRIQNILQYKQKLAAVYFNEIKNQRVTLPGIPPGHNHTWQTFHLLLSEDLDQQKTMQQLKEKNIGTNYGAQCIPAQEYYRNKYGYDASSLFPSAYKAFTKGLALPLYERLTEQQVVYISQIINQL